MEQRNGKLREAAGADGAAVTPAPVPVPAKASAAAARRFLADLRALRARAGLDEGELAARAHYPRDVISMAESVLPELPVLAAYVRGCGGTGEDVVGWEDRWRSVTGATASPLVPVRVAGLSSAASAGARVSAAPLSTASTDGQDPSVIVAALNRFAERMAQPTAPAPATDSGAASDSGAAPGSGPAAGGSPAARGTGTAESGGVTSGDPAGQDRLGSLQHMPRERPGRVGDRSSRTLTVVVIAAALLLLLLLLLAL